MLKYGLGFRRDDRTGGEDPRGRDKQRSDWNMGAEDMIQGQNSWRLVTVYSQQVTSH